MKNSLAFALLLILGLSATLVGQEKEAITAKPKMIYKLDFTVYELGDSGKRTNERSYTMHLLDGDRRGASTRVGTRVPVAADKAVQYIDVGVNIEAYIQEADDSSIVLSTKFESSGFAIPEQGQQAQPGTPIIRQTSENVVAKVGIGKPTMICSVDDVNSKRRMQLEVTATRVK